MSRRAPLGSRLRAAALLFGVALGACGGPPVAPTPPDPTGAGPLDGRAYAFCHEPDRFERWERDYCALVDDEVAHRCPELAAACAVPLAASKPPAGCDQPPPARDLDAPSEGAFRLFGEVLRWTLALLIALGVAAILGVAARVLLARRRAAAPARPVAARPVVTVAADEPVERAHPADTLLDRARAALDAGRFDEAVIFARGAALRGLADAGEVALHPSRTDREVLRTFKGDPSRRDALRALVAAVEGVRWGHLPPAPERARALVAAAARLLGATLLALALVGRAEAAPEHAPDGYAALVTVWRDAGLEARPRFRSLDALSGDVRVLFVDVDVVWLSPPAWERLDTWVADQGGTLVIAGTPPDGGPFGYGVGLRGDDASGSPAPVAFEPFDPVTVPRWPGGPNATVLPHADDAPWPLITDAGSGAVYVDATPRGDGWLVRVPDGRALRNAAFVRPENEAFAHRLGVILRDGELGPAVGSGRVEVVVGLLAEGADHPVDSLRNANLLPLVAQLLVLLAVAAWWRGVPFGRPRDPAERARAAMRDHAVALGARYRALGATRRVAASLAALWLERLGAVGLAAAAERHGRTPAEARDLVARAKALADAPEDDDRPDDLKIVEELWTITRTP